MSLRAMAEHMNFLASMQATPLQMTMDAGDAAAETIDPVPLDVALDRCKRCRDTSAQMTMDASDAAAETIDPVPIDVALPRCGSAADIWNNITLPRATRSSATEIVEVTSGWNPLHLRDERDVELMTVWHFRYWSIKPYRPEGVLHLHDDGEVRLTTPDADSDFHGSWRNVERRTQLDLGDEIDGEMFITCQRSTTTSSDWLCGLCLFYQPRDSDIWLCENPSSVVMQFSHTTQVARPPVRVPFGQRPEPPPPPPPPLRWMQGPQPPPFGHTGAAVFGHTGAEAAGDDDTNWYDAFFEQRLRLEIGILSCLD